MAEVDYVPTEFVIKVFETKELAEENNDNNALQIFHNGRDGTSPDPRVSNGAQFFSGVSESPVGNTLVDSSQKFGSRLVGKKIIETTTSPSVTYTIDSFVNETTLGLKDVPDTGAVGSAAAIAASKAYHIVQPGPFFLFHKYFYRLESTDPVSGFIIDWDDGEDNSPEKANRQTIKLESPQYYAIVDHTYTKHGVFYPMVRTISPNGFFSKWYVSNDAVQADTLKSIETQAIGNTQNEFSIVSSDVEQTTNKQPRIPEISPANMPPIGVLKTDRTSIFSGIDNSVIPVTDIAGHVEPKGYAHVYRNTGAGETAVTAMDANDNAGAVEVIYRTHTDRIIREKINPHTTAGHADALFPSTATDGFLKEILSVKLLELREGTTASDDRLAPDERVYIQVFDSDGDTADTIEDDTITILSLGNPLQTIDRPGFSLLADGSQSQTRASNVSISKYWFEEGKLAGTTRQGASIANISDAFDATDDFDQTESNLRSHYSFSKKHNMIDNTFKRFYDEERLYRLQVEDSSADTRNDGTSGATAHGKSGDSCVKSFIEHWDRGSYVDDLNRPSSLHSRALLLYGNLPHGAAATGETVTWSDKASHCNIQTGVASATNGDPYLVFGGSQHSSDKNDTELTGAVNGHDNHPNNWLFCGKTERFNKLHIRMNNDLSETYLSAATGGLATSSDSETGIFSKIDPAALKANITAWYSAKADKTGTTYAWKPLSIVDGTASDGSHTSLRRSGTVYFEMPDDWVSIMSNNINSGNWKGPVNEDSASGSEAPTDLWVVGKEMYGLLLGIGINNEPSIVTKWPAFKCASVYPYNNTHSQAIKVVDPHHKSINEIAFAQSVMWNRNGEYVEITDRLGRSEVRKIGASGGQITFGGVELGDGGKVKINKYQRLGTPVYLDVERRNGDYIRFYGVITAMSEDYPTGKALPRFGLTMAVEYVVEYDTNGEWISEGLMSLGGEVIDEPKYIL